MGCLLKTPPSAPAVFETCCHPSTVPSSTPVQDLGRSDAPVGAFGLSHQFEHHHWHSWQISTYFWTNSIQVWRSSRHQQLFQFPIASKSANFIPSWISKSICSPILDPSPNLPYLTPNMTQFWLSCRKSITTFLPGLLLQNLVWAFQQNLRYIWCFSDGVLTSSLYLTCRVFSGRPRPSGILPFSIISHSWLTITLQHVYHSTWKAALCERLEYCYYY